MESGSKTIQRPAVMTWKSSAVLFANGILFLLLIFFPLWEKGLSHRIDTRIETYRLHLDSLSELSWLNSDIAQQGVDENTSKNLLQLTLNGHWRATLERLARPAPTRLTVEFPTLSAQKRRELTLQQNDITLIMTELSSVSGATPESHELKNLVTSLTTKTRAYKRNIKPYIAQQISSLNGTKMRAQQLAGISLGLTIVPFLAVCLILFSAIKASRQLRQATLRHESLLANTLSTGDIGITITDGQFNLLHAQFPALNIDFDLSTHTSQALTTAFAKHLNDSDLALWKTHLQALLHAGNRGGAEREPNQVTLLFHPRHKIFQIHCQKIRVHSAEAAAVLTVFLPFLQDKHATRHLAAFKRKTQQEFKLIERLTKLDASLAYDFFSDAEQTLKECAIILSKLQSDTIHPDKYQKPLLHAFHQLKGDCAILQLNELAKRFHNLEECVIALQPEQQFALQTLIKLFSGTRRQLQKQWTLLRKYSPPPDNSPKRKTQSTLAQRLSAYAQKIAQDTGKEVAFHVSGIQWLVNHPQQKALLTVITQLLRNAIAHGIESPSQRKRGGKPSCGRIQLTLKKDERKFVLSLKDDGNGIDVNAVMKNCDSQKIQSVITNRKLTGQQLFELMATPGLSTQRATSEHAGRGMGLSIIKRQLSNIGGRVHIRTRRHQFTEFIVALPPER